MVNPKGWHVKKESDAKISKRWFTRPPMILFVAAILVVIVAGALVTQQMGVTFMRSSNPNLTLSQNSLAFGTVTDNTISQLATFTITNTGDTPLALSYSIQGGNWPTWATLHLAMTGPYNQGGTDIGGFVLNPTVELTVYPSLQIGQGSGPQTDFSGTVFINGA